MIVEYKGKTYETVIDKPIHKGDLYFDHMVNQIKECQSFICYDPWSLKLQEIKKEEENEINR